MKALCGQGKRQPDELTYQRERQFWRGNGVVVNLEALFAELEHNGILSLPGWEKRLLISENAHLVFNIHMQVDGMQEQARESQSTKLGTTKRGIGPAYSAKCFRNGIRVADLLGPFERFETKFRNLVAYYQKLFPSLEVNIDAELAQLKDYAKKLRDLEIVCDTVSYLWEARVDNKKILIEGANGALLDIDFGTYPYVTSSNCTVGGACTGLGLPTNAIGDVIGVVKAYQTRVGTGPFPTELTEGIGDQLQSIGKEVGVTTGRRRRCGWLDLVLLRRSQMINGFTGFALTKLDIMDTFPEVKIGVAYKINGQLLKSPPVRNFDWDQVEVVYETLPGWQTDISQVRKWDDLPENCKQFIRFIEDFVHVPVRWIGVGQDREALIVRD
uniref:Adenylosuccinate synthetase n=1 Tax=Plectus sambesii TaxID=2011161 RepID=A0A914XHB1_9BILA